MDKRSGSRKKLLLKVLPLLIVCAFLATSLVPSVGNFGTGEAFPVHHNPLISRNDNPSSVDSMQHASLLSDNKSNNDEVIPLPELFHINTYFLIS